VDNKLYKMHRTYIKIRYIMLRTSCFRYLRQVTRVTVPDRHSRSRLTKYNDDVRN